MTNKESIAKQLEELDVVETCNCCGKEFELNMKTPTGIENQGKIIAQDVYFGYGSEFDGQSWSWDICEDCIKKFVDGFKFPVKIQDAFASCYDEDIEAMRAEFMKDWERDLEDKHEEI